MTRKLRLQRERDERVRRRREEKEQRRQRQRGKWRRTVSSATRLARATATNPECPEMAFYATVAGVALVGQAQAASEWLHWHWLPAAVAVGAIELGGVVLLARADARRRKGERANAARALSLAVAVFAIAVNWFGHLDNGGPTLAGGFFAGMSALGYAVWLIRSADRRRDARRKDGAAATPPPDYGVLRWILHPVVTRRARELHARDPQLGLYGSLDAAVAALTAEDKRKKLAKLVRKQMKANLKDRKAAAIATASYDLDKVADMLARQADYTGLVDVLGKHLAPTQIVEVADTEAAAEVPVETPPAPQVHTLPVPHVVPTPVLPELPSDLPNTLAELEGASAEPSTDVKALPPQSARGALHAVPSQSSTGGVHTPSASTKTVKGQGSQSGKKNAPPPEVVKAAEAAASKVLGGGGSGADAARAYMKVVKEAGFDYSPTKVAAAADITRERVYQIARA